MSLPVLSTVSNIQDMRNKGKKELIAPSSKKLKKHTRIMEERTNKTKKEEKKKEVDGKYTKKAL